MHSKNGVIKTTTKTEFKWCKAALYQTISLYYHAYIQSMFTTFFSAIVTFVLSILYIHSFTSFLKCVKYQQIKELFLLLKQKGKLIVTNQNISPRNQFRWEVCYKALEDLIVTLGPQQSSWTPLGVCLQHESKTIPSKCYLILYIKGHTKN